MNMINMRCILTLRIVKIKTTGNIYKVFFKESHKICESQKSGHLLPSIMRLKGSSLRKISTGRQLMRKMILIMTHCVRNCSIKNEKSDDFGEIVVCLIFSICKRKFLYEKNILAIIHFF